MKRDGAGTPGLMPAYAHTKEGCPPEEWHRLEDHLRDVAALARRFASKWGAGEWGHYAGLWHDVGKFRAEFQEMLRSAAADVEAESGAPRQRVNHSSAGALMAAGLANDRGLPLAFVIAGHHAGLADLTSLRSRIADDEREHLAAAERGGATADWLRYRDDLVSPSHLETASNASVEFWIRMLFSALIDADRLDTERFHSPARPGDRAFTETVKGLKEKLDDALTRMTANAKPTPMNRARREVLDDCRARAAEPPGVFTLTVPTGGGKTLASVAFALDHAVAHSLERVIVVIPYTSIIEQNARVFRSIFGDDAVIEHHSSFDPPSEPSRLWLAADNWDAPFIITTSVQFFESLFANRTSGARKLHNIARAVVVFDEVQTFPTSLLTTIADGLSELTQRYGSSLVLATATQPALGRRPGFPRGVANPREIIASPERHFRELERVDVRWPADLKTAVAYDELALRIEAHDRVLAIVHLRNDARDLATRVDGAFHLSALMCATHRSKVLDAVRARLAAGAPCRVIATQLVEAGVDVDFPVVFRALAGLDSIAQAAGRCNREGMLTSADGTPRRGLVEVFVAPTVPPRGVLRSALDVTRAMLNAGGGALDLNDPQLFDQFFKRLYFSQQLDARGIQAAREGFLFATVAEKFQMIESGWQAPIIIPYDEEARSAIESVRQTDDSVKLRRSARRLQRYSVNIARGRRLELLNAGIAEDLRGNGAFVVLRAAEHTHFYDEIYGLDLSKKFALNPEDLIA